MRLVLALGGNALQRAGDDGTVESELTRAQASLAPLAELLAGREKMVLTHGNGPQVGHALLRTEAALDEAPPRPLDHLVSDTQGGLGYLLERTLRNLIQDHGGSREVVAMLAQVEVDPDDPAFATPTKPVGPWYPVERREALEARGWVLVERERGLRRVVPSPHPQAIVELEIIRSLFENRMLTVTAGGGGVPVVHGPEGYRGIEGVIDKDSVASLLARELNASHLIIATDVEHVWVGPDREPLGEITATALRRHLAAGEFPTGSMAPKVAAALEFVEAGGETAIITATEKVMQALAGETGTRVVAG